MSDAPAISREVHDILGRYDPERYQRWRKAGRLWSFTCRALPYGVTPIDAHLRTYGRGARYGAFTPEVLDVAVNGPHPAPVCMWHGHYSPDRPRPLEYGQVTACWDTPVALYVEAFTCTPVEVGQAVSIHVEGTAREWCSPDGVVAEVKSIVELSLCSEPGTPTGGAIPGAEVLSVTELTRAEVEYLRAR